MRLEIRAVLSVVASSPSFQMAGSAPGQVPSLSETMPIELTSQAGQGSAAAVSAPQLVDVPLGFEPNLGQTDSQVEYLAQGSGYNVFLTGGDAVIALQQANGSGQVVRLDVIGANPNPSANGQDLLASRDNYLIGDQADWQTNIASYGAVEYNNIYDGIGLRYYGNQEQLEYDFTVNPGADPRTIRLNLQGVLDAQVADNGDLVLTINEQGQEIAFKAPVAYQDGPNGRTAVASRYVLNADGTIGFEVGSYDTSRPLVIDPTLDYSTYLGGNNNDLAQAVAVDSAGNAYVTGYNNGGHFPTTVGAYQTATSGGDDVFVSKFNAMGTAFVYSTYLGGSSDDEGMGIAVDSSGQAYVVGNTKSNNFPTLNAFQAANGGGEDAFLTVLNAAGNGLVYSTYFGGAGAGDTGAGIAFNPAGDVVITGSTNSSGLATAGAYKTSLTGTDAYVAEFDTSQSGSSSRLDATYFGGSGNDTADGLALDTVGDIYITGDTQSNNLPVTAGRVPVLARRWHGCVRRRIQRQPELASLCKLLWWQRQRGRTGHRRQQK